MCVVCTLYSAPCVVDLATGGKTFLTPPQQDPKDKDPVRFTFFIFYIYF